MQEAVPVPVTKKVAKNLNGKPANSDGDSEEDDDDDDSEEEEEGLYFINKADSTVKIVLRVLHVCFGYRLRLKWSC